MSQILRLFSVQFQPVEKVNWDALGSLSRVKMGEIENKHQQILNKQDLKAPISFP